MTAEEHNKTLSMLHFIYGGIHGLTLAALVLLILVARVASPISLSISSFWISVGIVGLFVVFIVVVLLPLIAGYALRRRKSWTRPLVLATGVISLLNLPIGTALGIYAIKFFRSAAGSTLYGGSAATGEAELQGALNKNRQLSNLADRLN